jgi:hypothetical protein
MPGEILTPGRERLTITCVSSMSAHSRMPPPAGTSGALGTRWSRKRFWDVRASSHRPCDVVVGDGGLAVDEVVVILRVKNGDLGVLAREAFDVRP